MYHYLQIYEFLQEADKLFPVPISKKHNLDAFAKKLCEKATLCAISADSSIAALVAGYTDNVSDGLGYISIVATLPRAQGKGYGGSLIREFLEIARKKGLHAVHLYTVRDNVTAMRMYRKLGFVDYITENEPRPNDIHLIYHFDKEKQE